ncbi:MAG: hypothetical protein ACRBBN_13170 [Methyloligellaceae bacterium]
MSNTITGGSSKTGFETSNTSAVDSGQQYQNVLKAARQEQQEEVSVPVEKKDKKVRSADARRSARKSTGEPLKNREGSTFDFLKRYFGNTGKTLHLSDINLDTEFENAPSVKMATEKFMSATRASKDPIVKNTEIAHTNVTNDGSQEAYSPWPSLFSVGDNKLKMEGQCNETSCEFKFSLEDDFVDALDIHDQFRGNQDISTPYKIRHSWTVKTPR